MVLSVWTWQTSTPCVRAQEVDEARAVKVKAAYVYNFAKFIEWPGDVFEDNESPFVVGVLGDGPIEQALRNTVASKKIANRSVTVERLTWTKLQDRRALARCQVLYVSDSEKRVLGELFASLKDKPVLLVSGIEAFARDGGMIGFVLEKERIIFEINREALDQAALKVSAKLLTLARIVERKVKRSAQSGVGAVDRR